MCASRTCPTRCFNSQPTLCCASCAPAFAAVTCTLTATCRASGTGRIRAGGVERDVTFTTAAPESHAGIDQAYHAKYDRYGPAIVGTVVGEQVVTTTLRLVPQTA